MVTQQGTSCHHSSPAPSHWCLLCVVFFLAAYATLGQACIVCSSAVVLLLEHCLCISWNVMSLVALNSSCQIQLFLFFFLTYIILPWGWSTLNTIRCEKNGMWTSSFCHSTEQHSKMCSPMQKQRNFAAHRAIADNKMGMLRRLQHFRPTDEQHEFIYINAALSTRPLSADYFEWRLAYGKWHFRWEWDATMSWMKQKQTTIEKILRKKKKPTSFCCFHMELEITWEHRRGNSEASQIFSKGKEIIWSTGNYIHWIGADLFSSDFVRCFLANGICANTAHFLCSPQRYFPTERAHGTGAGGMSHVCHAMPCMFEITLSSFTDHGR